MIMSRSWTELILGIATPDYFSTFFSSCYPQNKKLLLEIEFSATKIRKSVTTLVRDYLTTD